MVGNRAYSTIVTGNLPFDDKDIPGALLDRLTRHGHILEMNGESFRRGHGKRRARRPKADSPPAA